jgi:cation:H+ antiporter
MAVSNIIGSNMFCLGLLALADAFYTPGPIMPQIDRSATFAAALGLVLTAVYLWGMIERRDRTILRMGVDSAVVITLYPIGLLVLYTLRGDAA